MDALCTLSAQIRLHGRGIRLPDYLLSAYMIGLQAPKSADGSHDIAPDNALPAEGAAEISWRGTRTGSDTRMHNEGLQHSHLLTKCKSYQVQDLCHKTWDVSCLTSFAVVST